MLRNQILFFVALFLGASFIVKAEDYVVPEGVSILTKEQLFTQIIGNSFAGGSRWVEYYEPALANQQKGKIKGYGSAVGKYTANWRIKDSLMCWKYAGNLSTYDGCYTIALDGEVATWYNKYGRRYRDPAGRIKLLPGNPEKL